MKTSNREFSKVKLSWILAGALLTAQPSIADDIEIYQIEEHKANLLMVLDVSGSMCFAIDEDGATTTNQCYTQVDPELKTDSRGYILRQALNNILDNADPSIAVGMTRFGWDGTMGQEVCNQFGQCRIDNKLPSYTAYGHGIQMPVFPLGDNSKEIYDAHVAEYGQFGNDDYMTDVDRTWKESLKAVLDKDFRVRGGTPLVDGLYESARFWLGLAPDSGHQQQHIWPNDYNNSGINATAKRGPTAHDMTLSADNGHYVAPATGSPCETNAIVLLTDGEPSVQQHLNNIEKLIGRNSCTHEGYTIVVGYDNRGNPVYENSGECGVELAAAMHDGMENRDKTSVNIDTYTIGFALPSNSRAKSYLSDIATAGGGEFYDATDKYELIESFNDILAKITQSNSTFSSGSVSTNGDDQFHHQDAAYLSMFQPGLTTKWPGNIKKYKVDDSTLVDRNGSPVINPSSGEFYDTSYDFWNALSTPDGNDVTAGGAISRLTTNRTLWVDNDAHSSLQVLNSSNLDNSDFVDVCAFNQYTEHKCVEEKRSGGLLATLLTEISDTIFGNGDEQLNFSFDRLVGFTQGINADGTARKFAGDPLHSLQVAVNYPGDKQLLFYNTNEGYLHAVDSDDGEEQWAFIPRELLPNQVNFYRNQSYILNQKLRQDPENADEYRATYAEHIYGLDGDVQVWHNDANSNRLVDTDETALLIVGMRRGGRNYYVLDISNPATPELAFTIEGGVGTGNKDFTELGYTWSPPSVYSVMDGGEEKHVMVIGGGYDEIEDNDGEDLANATRRTNTGSNYIGRAIYIVGLEGEDQGKILWKADYISDNHMTSSIPAGVAGMDTDGDFITDRLYTVDVGGRVWSVKLDQEDIGNSTLHLFADLNDGNTSEGNRHFYYTPAVTVEYSGGETFKAITLGSGFRAHPLDETIQDRMYMLMDDDTVYDDAARKITESALYDATSNQIGKQSSKSFQSEIYDAGKRGWYFDLTTGEKSLSSTVLFNHKMLFTTYEPAEAIPNTDPDVCSVSSRGNAYIYVIDILDATPMVGLANDNYPADETNRRKQMSLHDIPNQPVVMLGDGGPELLAGRDVVTDYNGESALDTDTYREESWIDVLD